MSAANWKNLDHNPTRYTEWAMRKRPDYGNAKPEDLARALLRPVRPKKQRLGTSTRSQSIVGNKVAVHEPLPHKPRS